MKGSICKLQKFIVLVTVSLLSVFSTSAVAQTVTYPVPPKMNGGGTPSAKALQSATRNRAKLAAYNNAAWYALINQGACTNPQSQLCANSALVLAGSTCSSSALLFQKGTGRWQTTQFILVLASAGFTGVGAAATIAGSTTVPKIFSTLGGTTGLGAVTASANTNIGDNQAGIAAINTIQAEIQKLPSPVASDNATNQSILSQADGYANQCVAANPSGTTGGTAPTS